MISPKKVGEGSYGCVHNPPLKCKNKPYNPDLNKESKILTRKHANSELKEFKLIQDADKKEDFHLGKPDSCFPDTNLDNKIGIDECNRFDSNDIDKYKLLLDEHASLSKKLEDIQNKEKLEQKKQQEFSEKIDELNQETDTLLEEIDKWQM